LDIGDNLSVIAKLQHTFQLVRRKSAKHVDAIESHFDLFRPTQHRHGVTVSVADDFPMELVHEGEKGRSGTCHLQGQPWYECAQEIPD
jgi:hypothetical protein